MTNAPRNQIRASYEGRKSVVTGGFGFKGTWLAFMLRMLGAEVAVVGHCDPESQFSGKILHSDFGIEAYDMDVRSPHIREVISEIAPNYVFHLAAQPIVLEGYQNPSETFSTNVMGTVNVLDAIRALQKPVSVVNVTTDKVYRDLGQEEPYVENDELRGLDPYSSSKSCSELVTFSYRESFFKDSDVVLSTCRAGNVLGGGDYSDNRIVPDIVRAMRSGESVGIRNFNSVRPYEHVLDALYAYLVLAAHQFELPELAGSYNVGPNDDCLMKTGEIVSYAQENFGLNVDDLSDPNAPHETTVLKLDSSLFRSTFNWEPLYNTKKSILETTFDWYNQVDVGSEVAAVTLDQVRSYLND